jgi:hypothetical protein
VPVSFLGFLAAADPLLLQAPYPLRASTLSPTLRVKGRFHMAGLPGFVSVFYLDFSGILQAIYGDFRLISAPSLNVFCKPMVLN